MAIRIVLIGLKGLLVLWASHEVSITFVKQFPTVNRVNMFREERCNNQESPNISHDKVLATCVAILCVQPNTIRLINGMLCMTVNKDYIRDKNVDL